MSHYITHTRHKGCRFSDTQNVGGPCKTFQAAAQCMSNDSARLGDNSPIRIDKQLSPLPVAGTGVTRKQNEKTHFFPHGVCQGFSKSFRITEYRVWNNGIGDFSKGIHHKPPLGWSVRRGKSGVEKYNETVAQRSMVCSEPYAAHTAHAIYRGWAGPVQTPISVSMAGSPKVRSKADTVTAIRPIPPM